MQGKAEDTVEKQSLLATRKVQSNIEASSHSKKAKGFKQLKTRAAGVLLPLPWRKGGILASARYKLLSTISLGNTYKVPSRISYLLQHHPTLASSASIIPAGVSAFWVLWHSCLVHTSLYSKALRSFVAYRIHNSKLDITFLKLIPIAFIKF